MNVSDPPTPLTVPDTAQFLRFSGHKKAHKRSKTLMQRQETFKNERNTLISQKYRSNRRTIF